MRSDTTRHAVATSAIRVAICGLCLLPASLVGQSDTYRAEQEAWRTEREAALTADDSWLTVAGLFFLNEGDNNFGASPLNDMVIPGGPDHAGVFEYRDEGDMGRRVSVRAPAGQSVVVDGEPVTSALLYPTETERHTVTVGPLSLWVHYSGDRLAIRMRDPDSEIRKSFTGLKWFPVAERFRITGRFVPHDAPITVELPNILGDIEPFTSHGSVSLTVDGEDVSMLPMTSGTRLWFIFRDLTSGAETYPAARFLYADAPDEDGLVVVDFNRAYNPPCAFNPHTTCPLPPIQNRLGVRVEAGELDYH